MPLIGTIQATYTVNPETAALTLVGSAGDYGDRPHGGDQWIAYGGWPI